MDVPFSLDKGSKTATAPFKINISGSYRISVEATANKRLPLDDIICSLGLHGFSGHKECSASPVLRSSWVIYDGKGTVAAGTSDSHEGGWLAEGWSQAARTIGEFDGRKGQKVQLAVVSLDDANSLAPANPRIRVSLGGKLYESALIVTGLLNVPCAVVGIVGILLFVIPSRCSKPAR